MHEIDIYGFADREICEGCEGNCGESACSPGAKKPTRELIAAFEGLVSQAGMDLKIHFFEANDENIKRHPDVHRLLGMADLSPVILLDGKVLFLGGFSAKGLLSEVQKRLSASS